MKSRSSIRAAAAILISFVMLFSITACGIDSKNAGTDTGPEQTGQTGNETVSQDTAGAAVEEAIDPLGKYEPAIEISVVRALDGNVKFQSGDPNRESLEKNVWAKAYEEQLGIKLKYLWTPPVDQYEAKWNVAIASNDIPDMGTVSLKVLKTLVEGGMAEDLTEVVYKYAGPTYKMGLEEDNGITAAYNTFDGKLMGVPMIGTTPDDGQLLFVRADWLKKLNLPEPKTMEDVYAIAEAFTRNQIGGQGTFGLAACKEITQGISSLGGFFNGFHAYYDIWIQDKSGNAVYSTIQPEMRSALLKLQEMYKAGLLDKEFAVKDFSKAAEAIAAGKCGMTYGVYWGPLSKITDNIIADAEAEWKVYPAPSVDENPVVPQASSTPASFLFVKKGMEYPEAAVKMINLQFELTNTDAETYGTKDGWEYHSYRLITSLTLPWNNANSQRMVVEALKTGDTSGMNAYYLQNYNEVKKALAGERKSVPMNLVFGENSTFSIVNQYRESKNYLTTLYKTLPTETMDEKGQNMKLKLDEAILKVIMGAPVTDFDKAVDEWKKMGGDEITKEVNDWYQGNK